MSITQYPPLGHDKQSEDKVLPVELVCVPAAHNVQLEEPATLLNDPRGQGKHNGDMTDLA